MKRLLLYGLFFFFGYSNAQNVAILDPSFKNRLLTADVSNSIAKDGNGLPIRIDTNRDGEIQVSEAVRVIELDVTLSNIFYLHGIQGFSNLKKLKCSYNSIYMLDLSSNPALEFVECCSNRISSLNLTGLTNLSYLDCRMMSGQLTSLDLTGLTGLRVLKCGQNNIASLDVSPLVNLRELNCGYSDLSSLNLSGLINLQSLDCSSSQLTSLNFSGLASLRTLVCSYNQISSLNLLGLAGLEYLDCSHNNIASIGTGDLRNVTVFLCEDNNIAELDLSHSPYVSVLHCENNLPLHSINLKNGTSYTRIIGSNFNFQNTPNLEYICADDDEAVLLQNFCNGLGMTVTVSPYCTFTPGGNYNTITGTIRLDENHDGCDTDDRIPPFVKLTINDGRDESSVFSNADADYAFYTGVGTFTMTPAMENASFFSFHPSSTVVGFSNTNNNIHTQNFCIAPNGTHSDVEVVVAPIIPARPGFEAVYKVVYKNNGNHTVMQNSGITLLYNQNLMSFVSSDTAIRSQEPGSITWDLAALQPFESRSFTVAMNINRSTDSNPVNINDVLNFRVSAIASDDENTRDNSFELRQKVVSTYLPNDITCLEGEVVQPSEIGEYLHYLVRFENTGTATARNIVIRNEIDQNEYNVSSLQVVNSSHKLKARVKRNLAEFIFENVSLDSGGHGNILLKMRSNEMLSAEKSVSNRVGIYFDYETPVVTKKVTTVYRALSIGEHARDNSIKIYPNPADKQLNVRADGIIRAVHLYDAQGRILMTQLLAEDKISIDISRYAAGIYFVKVLTDEGAKTEKIINKK